MSLKRKKIDDVTNHYVDRDTNEPIFIEHKKPALSKWSNDSYQVEIHPEFKQTHDIDTPYTHLKALHRESRMTPEELGEIYEKTLSGEHHLLIHPGVKFDAPKIVNKEHGKHREHLVRDKDNEVIGKISFPHYDDSMDERSVGYGYHKDNKTIGNDSHFGSMSVDEKYVKKHKIPEILVKNIKDSAFRDSRSNTVGMATKVFRDIQDKKGKIPSFYGGIEQKYESDNHTKSYNTNLKPKVAIEKFLNHLEATEGLKSKQNHGTSGIGIGDYHIHHLTHITTNGGESRLIHTKSRIADHKEDDGHYIKKHNIIIEKYLSEVAEIPEIEKGRDVGRVLENSHSLLNKGESLNGKKFSHMVLGGKTKHGYTITYHYPEKRDDEAIDDNTRYVVAHKEIGGKLIPHIASSMDVETKGVPSFKIGSIAKHPESEIRGHELYSHFLRNTPEGTIISTDAQTKGSHHAWRNLAKMRDINVHGYDPESDQLINTDKYLSSDFDHETHANSIDPSTRPGRENNEAYRLVLVAHRK